MTYTEQDLRRALDVEPDTDVVSRLGDLIAALESTDATTSRPEAPGRRRARPHWARLGAVAAAAAMVAGAAVGVSVVRNQQTGRGNVAGSAPTSSGPTPGVTRKPVRVTTFGAGIGPSQIPGCASDGPMVHGGPLSTERFGNFRILEQGDTRGSNYVMAYQIGERSVHVEYCKKDATGKTGFDEYDGTMVLLPDTAPPAGNGGNYAVLVVPAATVSVAILDRHGTVRGTLPTYDEQVSPHSRLAAGAFTGTLPAVAVYYDAEGHELGRQQVGGTHVAVSPAR